MYVSISAHGPCVSKYRWDAAFNFHPCSLERLCTPLETELLLDKKHHMQMSLPCLYLLILEKRKQQQPAKSGQISQRFTELLYLLKMRVFFSGCLVFCVGFSTESWLVFQWDEAMYQSPTFQTWLILTERKSKYLNDLSKAFISREADCMFSCMWERRARKWSPKPKAKAFLKGIYHMISL